MPYAREPEDRQKPRLNSQDAPRQSSEIQSKTASGKVVDFKPKEVDMMPADWAMPGNPSPYELCSSIHTCKRLWRLNKDALTHPDCDVEATEQNIKVLEKLYLLLMDYLVE